jgi:predicted phage tail protein
VLGGALFGLNQLFQPKQPKGPGKAKPSFVFGEVVNTTEEGVTLPYVYGTRVRVGSVVGAAGLSVEEIGT